MKTRAEGQAQHELYEKFTKLDRQKDIAIKKAMDKFYAVPLETQDIEYIAWLAFIETEKVYNPNKGRKTYESFFRDCLYWKAKDYLVKYSTNKHKVCNFAVKLERALHKNETLDGTNERVILDRLAIQAYITLHKNDDRGIIARLFMLGIRPIDMCRDLKMSKSKLYRVISLIKKDLSRILDRQ